MENTSELQSSSKKAMRYTLEEYVDMVLMFGLANQNAGRAKRYYMMRFPDRQHPCRDAFIRTVKRLRSTGRVMPTFKHVNKRAQKISIECQERIIDAFKDNKSIRYISRMAGVSASSVYTCLKRKGFDGPRPIDEYWRQTRKGQNQTKNTDNEPKNKDSYCLRNVRTRNGNETTYVEYSDSDSDTDYSDDSEGSDFEDQPTVKVEYTDEQSESHVLQNIKQESTTPDENQSTNIVLNTTAEFNGTLDSYPTNETIGEREGYEQKPMEFEFVAIQNTKDGTMFIDEIKSEAVTTLDGGGHFLA